MWRLATVLTISLANAAIANSEWLWVSPSLAGQTPIPSFTTYGFSSRDPSSEKLGKRAQPARLRITDASVRAISTTHVLITSSETEDVLLLPLKKAAMDFQVRGRAGSALSEAITLKGDAPDDDFSANAWFIEDGARRMNYSRTRKTIPPATASANTSGPDPARAAPNAYDGHNSAAKAHEDAMTQMQRSSYDSQRQAARQHEDSIRNHNRLAEDAQNGFDQMRHQQQFSADSQVDMNRQMHDANLQGIRSMNDAARQSGMAPTIPEPTFYNPAFP